MDYTSGSEGFEKQFKCSCAQICEKHVHIRQNGMPK